MGGKEGRKGGRHTRWFHSGDPVSTACVKKKKGKERKNINQPVKNKRGKKGRTLSSLAWASLFSLSLLQYFFLFSLPLCFTYILNLCPPSCFFFHHPIILSPSVSLRHVFQGLPSIDTVSTNSSPPVPSKEPHGDGGELGEGLWGRPAGYVVIRLS